MERPPSGPQRARPHVPALAAFRSLTVRENVEVAALGVGVSPREARRRGDGDCSALLGLGALRGRSGRLALPHGDERRLGVARALATEPLFVLMDEPAAGLPEAEVPEFAAVVAPSATTTTPACC